MAARCRLLQLWNNYFNKLSFVIVLILCLGMGIAESQPLKLPPIKLPPAIPEPLPMPIPLLCASELKTALRYDAAKETLNIDLSIVINQPVRWNVWLTSHGEVTSILSMTMPEKLEQPLSFPISMPYFPPQGRVGVLTTLTTPIGGIVCSKFVTVNTGMPFLDFKS